MMIHIGNKRNLMTRCGRSVKGRCWVNVTQHRKAPHRNANCPACLGELKKDRGFRDAKRNAERVRTMPHSQLALAQERGTREFACSAGKHCFNQNCQRVARERA